MELDRYDTLPESVEKKLMRIGNDFITRLKRLLERLRLVRLVWAEYPDGKVKLRISHRYTSRRGNVTNYLYSPFCTDEPPTYLNSDGSTRTNEGYASVIRWWPYNQHNP